MLLKFDKPGKLFKLAAQPGKLLKFDKLIYNVEDYGYYSNAQKLK